MLKFLQTAKILEFQNFGKMHNGVQKSAKKIDFAYKTQVSLLNNFSNRLTIFVKFNCKKKTKKGQKNPRKCPSYRENRLLGATNDTFSTGCIVPTTCCWNPLPKGQPFKHLQK